MNKISKLARYALTASAVVVASLGIVFISPRDVAVRNEARVVDMLCSARPEFNSEDPRQVIGVHLTRGAILRPSQRVVESGYVLRLNSRASKFSIEAEPLKAGKTGLFSLLRDESGIVRFEPELGRPANAASRVRIPSLTGGS